MYDNAPFAIKDFKTFIERYIIDYNLEKHWKPLFKKKIKFVSLTFLLLEIM